MFSWRDKEKEKSEETVNDKTYNQEIKEMFEMYCLAGIKEAEEPIELLAILVKRKDCDYYTTEDGREVLLIDPTEDNASTVAAKVYALYCEDADKRTRLNRWVNSLQSK